MIMGVWKTIFAICWRRSTSSKSEWPQRMILLSSMDGSITSTRKSIGYCTRSERTSRLLDQIELQFEELQSSATEDEIAAEKAVAKTTTVTAFTRRRVSFTVFRAALWPPNAVIASC
jgi:transposase